MDTLQTKPKKISSGGSAANTVHGASLLGAKSYYLGRVANDVHGKHYTEDMRNCGVGFCLIADKKNLNKIKKIFPKQYKPYEIGFLSKNKDKFKISGKLQWKVK